MNRWTRCYFCNRKGGDWRKGQSGYWTISAPRGVEVSPDQDWTCRLCIRLGKPQVTTMNEQEKDQLQKTTLFTDTD